MSLHTCACRKKKKCLDEKVDANEMKRNEGPREDEDENIISENCTKNEVRGGAGRWTRPQGVERDVHTRAMVSGGARGRRWGARREDTQAVGLTVDFSGRDDGGSGRSKLAPSRGLWYVLSGLGIAGWGSGGGEGVGGACMGWGGRGNQMIGSCKCLVGGEATSGCRL